MGDKTVRFTNKKITQFDAHRQRYVDRQDTVVKVGKDGEEDKLEFLNGESALSTSASKVFAILIVRSVLPTAVGPSTTINFGFLIDFFDDNRFLF